MPFIWNDPVLTKHDAGLVMFETATVGTVSTWTAATAAAEVNPPEVTVILKLPA